MVTDIDKTELDHEGIKRRMGGDGELIAEFVEMFLETYPESLEEISEAIEKGDSERLHQASHSLKGALQNFFTGRIVGLSFELEKKGRSGDMTGVEEIHAQLEEEFIEIDPLVEELRRSI